MILALGKAKSQESLIAAKRAAKTVIYLGLRSTLNGWRSSSRENPPYKLSLADSAGKLVISNQK